MPEHEYPITWSAPEELTDSDIWLAALLYPALVAEISRVYRFGALSSREGRLLRKTMPRGLKVQQITAEDAFNILLSAEILRQAVTSQPDRKRVPVSQGEDIKAEELVGEQILAQGDTGQAD